MFLWMISCLFSLIFWSLLMMWLISWHAFLWDFPLRVTDILQPVNLCFWPNLWKFQPVFLQMFFSVMPYLSSTHRTLMTWIFNVFIVVPQVLESLFFPVYFFLPLLWLVNFYCPILHSFIFSLLYILLNLPSELILFLYFLVLKFPLVSYLYLLFICWQFLFLC